MKRSIDGILYDTEQATLLGEYLTYDGLEIIRIFRGNHAGCYFGVRERKPGAPWWHRLFPAGGPLLFKLSAMEATDTLVNSVGDVGLVKARA